MTLTKDRVEAIVEQDLKRHYPDLTNLEFLEVGDMGSEWWIKGTFSTKQKVDRNFDYALNYLNGKIIRSRIS